MELDKMERAVEEIGGRFKFTVLMQKRLVELQRGAPPLVPAEDEADYYEVILDEILQGKLQFKDRFEEDAEDGEDE